MEIHVKISLISICYPFPGLKLQFYHIFTYLSHIAASNTVIDYFTKWFTYRIFNTNW